MEKLSIKNVLEQLNETIFLPDIQRELDWFKKGQIGKITDLFDSLMKEYPIGVFFEWQRKGNDLQEKNTVLERFTCDYDQDNPNNISFEAKNEKSFEINVPIHLILDGQQRLTALYVGFKGSLTVKDKRKKNPRIKKELYLDLTYKPTEGTSPKGPNYRFAFLSEEELLEKPQPKNWFKCKDIEKMKNVTAIIKLCQDRFGQTEDRDKALDILSRLDQIYSRDTDILNFQRCPDKVKDLEEAAEVFARINKCGIPLKKTDFLLSYITARFPSKKNKNVKEEIREYIRGVNEKGFSQFDAEAFLIACTVLVTEKAKFKTDDFTPNVVNNIEKKWDEIIESIDNASDKLRKFGYAGSKIAVNIIISLAFAYYKKRLFKIGHNDDRTILNLIAWMQLVGFFDKDTTGSLQTVINAIKESETFQDGFNKLKKDKAVSLDNIKEVIEKDIYGSSRAFSILYLISEQCVELDTYEIDHIYPQAAFNKGGHLKGKREFKDKLFNLQLLSKSDNASKGDSEPEEWLTTAHHDSQERNQFISRQCLPKIPLTWEAFEEFKKQREKMLMSKLREKLGVK